MPADTVPHTRTWMAWPARGDIWGKLLPAVRHDIAAVADAIAQFEPVAMVTRLDQASSAAAACGPGVQIVPIENDDLWMRDMGPLFLVNGKGGLAGLDMNFNGWGNKQAHVNDARVAERVLVHLGVPRIVAPFVAEGGGLEVDGDGTGMANASSIVNPNRNPGLSQMQLTARICAALGLRKMIWLPGVTGRDITDDHIDTLARFASPAHVVVDQPWGPEPDDIFSLDQRRALGLLTDDTDARGRTLACVTSRQSRTIPAGNSPDSFVNAYVNWYACNGGIILPAFGDDSYDAAARDLAAELYPGRRVVQLRIDAIAAGGGGIHCCTQQQPMPVGTAA
jgi:agmatine deiminase